MLGAMMLASLLCVGFAHQAREERAHWEYKAACGQPNLNQLGWEGWELAAATQNGNVACFYFKRRQ